MSLLRATCTCNAEIPAKYLKFRKYTMEEMVKKISRNLIEQDQKRKKLANTDLFVLDNSLRESTVAQLRGHTIENKWKIYEEIKKVGFKDAIVASFSHMTRVGDTFIKQLKEKGEDFNRLWAFTEFVDSVGKDGMPDMETIPVGLRKMKELGMKNAIIEMDLVYHSIDYAKFTLEVICKHCSKWLKWVRENLAEDGRVLFNLRDFSDCMVKNPERQLMVVKYLSSLPEHERPFGLIFEELGKYLPEELGVWTAAVRQVMDDCAFKNGHLLVHVHEQWGMADFIQLECVMNGATGIWASLIVEGASMGHACSSVTLMNLVRMGNKKVLKKYNCEKLRKAAINVTKITTGKEAYDKQVIYGERALDMVFGIQPNKNEFSMAEFFGQEPVMRITTLASPKMILHRLETLFGPNPQFTEELAVKMKEKMLEDLNNNRKEEYMSKTGLAVLFDRSGGELTAEMAQAVAEDKPREAHAKILLDEIRVMWDEWDLKDGEKDDRLTFDAFYNGFMAPYFGCYRCEDTKKALKAIDMDEDGTVDWNEFALYLKWAIRQYPQTATAEDLLSIAFRKGLIPAMQDTVLQQE